jgi:pyruvate carboxylase
VDLFGPLRGTPDGLPADGHVNPATGEVIREAVPNLLLQMLLRSANAVGYANYPDNTVRYFVHQAADNGIDLFRIFDSLNWVENMRVAMDAVREQGALLEAAICYTGDITDPARPKYDLRYYVDLARQLEGAGAHVLGIKDMAGLCKPYAAHTLVKALRDEVDVPIHFHTHDASGINSASILRAADAGVDIADAALASMSGTTSQPCLNSLVAALKNTPRDAELNLESLNRLSDYWAAEALIYNELAQEWPKLEDLALRIVPCATWADLILPDSKPHGAHDDASTSALAR